MINDMDDQMIERLASEPSVIQAEREMLQKELQRLQSALRACSRHNIRASRVSRYRSMSAASPARGSKTASVKSSPESQRVNMFSVDLGNPPIGRSKLENASTGLLSTIVNPPGTGLFQPTLNSARQPAPNSPVRESRVADFSPTIPTINVHPPSDSKLPQNPDPGGLPTSSGRVDTPFKAPSAAEVVFGSTKFSAFRFDNSTVPSTLGVGTG